MGVVDVVVVVVGDMSPYALVVVPWCLASSSASITALRWEPVNIHV